MVVGMVTAAKVATIAGMAVLVALGGRAALLAYEADRADPRLGEAYVLAVDDGDTAADVARRLHRDGLIRSEFYFTSMVRLSGGAVEPGDHELRRGMAVPAIVAAVTPDEE